MVSTNCVFAVVDLDLGSLVSKQLAYVGQAILLRLAQVIESLNLAGGRNAKHEQASFEILICERGDGRNNLFAD
jgi:hypothetical protein